MTVLPWLIVLAASLLPTAKAWAEDDKKAERRLLYVASPGVRNYLEHGGHGILVFGIDKGHTVLKTVGPFSERIRPFTVNGSGTLCFVNVNKLLGFEVGDLTTGKMLHRVEVQGYEQGKLKRHGCPSHGVAMTPDETEIWVTDEEGREVQSEKLLEIDFRGNRPIRAGDQFGIGRKR